MGEPDYNAGSRDSDKNPKDQDHRSQRRRDDTRRGDRGDVAVADKRGMELMAACENSLGTDRRSA